MYICQLCGSSDPCHNKPRGINVGESKTEEQVRICIWKLAIIVTIPKPDIDKGTSYGPTSHLAVITKTLEKSLLPFKTANITNTPTQHGYKTQHSTLTALHTVNNTVANVFNQMGPPSRTIL